MRLGNRLSRIEARRSIRTVRNFRTVVVMPWDHFPPAGSADIVFEVNFVRPTGMPGGERVPYERTGVRLGRGAQR